LQSNKQLQEEVQQRWAALTLEQRQAIMVFDDPFLIERVKDNLQELFQKHLMMEQLGLASTDPFAASSILTSAFQFTWNRPRQKDDASSVRDASKQRGPIMVMKDASLQREELLHELRSTLPDFLSSYSGRTPMPRAKWKDMWVADFSSIQAVEKQLIKLMEQALWAMALDPAYAVPIDEEEPNPLVDAMEGDSVPFEPWMEWDRDANPKVGDAIAKKKKKGKKDKAKKKATNPLTEKQADEMEQREFSDADDADDYIEDHGRWGFQLPKKQLSTDLAAETPNDFGRRLETTSTAASGVRDDQDLEARDDPDFSQEGYSDDESVGMGVFHLGSAVSASEAPSLMPTATSTPPNFNSKTRRCASPAGRWRQSATSPSGSHSTIHPPSLVCYIWNQTSLLDQGAERFENRTGTATTTATGTPGSDPPTSHLRASSSESSTPSETAQERFSRRGGWLRPQLPGGATTPGKAQGNAHLVVVKNSFIDIVEPGELASSPVTRKARSLSPEISWQSLCDRHWYE